jgi:hypothetical protein
MVYTACDARGSAVQEFFDFSASTASEFHDQFSWQVPPTVRESDSEEDGCISLIRIVDAQPDLAALGSAAQGERDVRLRGCRALHQMERKEPGDA